ncbi:MAG: radical SAM family heme chaperone HemW [Pseudomonadota bacterium]
MTEPIVPFGPDYGFGAYIHWPYCARICPYCDFNVYAARQRDNAPLLYAIATDIAAHGHWLSTHPPLTSIYFGGGTPSLLDGSEIASLIDACEAAFGISPDAEVTIEANPQMVTADLARDWRAAGVNRLSLGVQSLADDALTFLGRDHSADQGRRAAEIALSSFDSVSLDLIYARPNQKTEDWEAELNAAIAIGAQHISLYELTIKSGTAFGKAESRGSLIPMPDDTQADLFELTHEIMTGAGYPAYEISNFAISPEFRSRHNLTYWRSGDWIGVGPGAHGRVTIGANRYATEAARKPPSYIETVKEHGRSASSTDTLSADDIAQEMLSMGLRTTEGIAPDRLETARSGLVDHDKLSELQSDGWLAQRHDRLVLNPAGHLLADRIVAELVA